METNIKEMQGKIAPAHDLNKESGKKQLILIKEQNENINNKTIIRKEFELL